MIKIWGQGGVALMLCCWLVGGPAFADPLRIVTEEYPPLNMLKEDGKICGVSTEILRAALDENKIEATIALFPWARAFEMGMNDNNTCVYSTTRTPERENLFKWAGPLVRNEWVLLGRSDSPLIKSLDEAKPYVIGGYTGDAVTLYLKKMGLRVEENSRDELNAEKLKRKRIDFWGASKLEGQPISQVKNTEGLIESLIFKKTLLYLACNKSVPDDVINKLNVTLKRMDDDGTIAAAIKKLK